MTVTVSCPCGHPIAVPMLFDTRDGAEGVAVDVRIDEADFAAVSAWHARRFHGGRDGAPQVAA